MVNKTRRSVPTTPATEAPAPASAAVPVAAANIPAATAPLSEEWQRRLEEEAREDAKRVTTRDKWLTTRAGILSLDGQPFPDNRIEVVILDDAIDQVLYTTSFDANPTATPDCFALARRKDQLAPHETVTQPRAERCAVCPQNQWERKVTTVAGATKVKNVKPCNTAHRFALFTASAIEKGPANIDAAEVVNLRIPRTSVRAWEEYLSRVANVLRRPVWSVITEIRERPDAKYQFSFTFDFVGAIKEADLPYVEAKRLAHGDRLLRPYERVTPMTAEQAAQATEAAAQVAARQAARKF
jgi:hypothetical protein